MKELSFEEMSTKTGGGAAEWCGFGVAVAIFATGGWALLGLGVAMTFCLTADAR
jgi:hypothetical protein